MNLIPWRSQKRGNGNGGPHDITTLPSLRNEIDGLFEHFFRDPFGEALGSWGGALRADLAESDDEVVVRVELPGVEPDDIELNVVGNTLTISGEKKQEREDQRRDYHYVERRFGSFRRSLELPASVDPAKVDAGFKNGVLTVTIAKRPDAKPRRIKVAGG